ncbi:hypothetical protein P253_01402 [Acinetobacter indicus CIP 110367]|uniref:Uncharacterized protein n=1 Tax=Acinetobacter indicus CIP 110367 TaxID=1341679 RepID=V2UJH4_9GAMM|nr:hypothetical protein [Acinetobacter indicus]EPF72282.1 TIGR02646 family protein [Acinetobacter indicus ANC 4215]ESK48751.1 hypothetical protein P253_01402 [Acinetobacter indicus CIP 110367]
MNFDQYICNYSGCRCSNQIWKCERFKSLKIKYKELLKVKFQNSCAYCQRALAHDENIIIDLEHVLPKAEYKKYIFNLTNLTISCRRCNTAPRKGRRKDFIVNNHLGSQYSINDFSAQNYKFIHPNLEDVTQFYELNLLQKGRRKYLRYELKNWHPKREYTIEFFKLKEIEVGSLSCH